MLARTLHPFVSSGRQLSTHSSKRVVAITGASGHIGTILREYLYPHYELIGIVPTDISSNIDYCTETIPCDLTIPDECVGIFKGCDAVIHLANNPTLHGTWDQVYRTNIAVDGNVMMEAGRVGISRLVYASSNHVNNGLSMDREPEMLNVGENGYGFHKDKVIHPRDPVAPDSYYGCGKVLGEALLRYHTLMGSMTGVALRIGWTIPDDDPTKVPKKAKNYMRAMYLSHRDCAGYFKAALDMPLDKSKNYYQVAYAISHNSTRVFDLSETCDALGYSPQDSSDHFYGHAGEASTDQLEGVEQYVVHGHSPVGDATPLVCKI